MARRGMKIFVLGAGMMGRAVVYDLAGARDVRHIVVGDFDRGRAAGVAKKFGRGLFLRMYGKPKSWRSVCVAAMW